MPQTSDGAFARLAGADADDFLDVGHEDLAVADLARLGRYADVAHERLHTVVVDHDLHLHLRLELDRVLRASVGLGVSALTAEPPHLGDRHAGDPELPQSLFDDVELERPDHSLDLL